MSTLYIVATPIGNLEDITFRALDTLRRVDYVLCEDTRITGKLLSRYSIDKKMVSMTDFNEESKIPLILNDLISGKNIALVSDAGTPLISDPGFKLVREAIGKGVQIESISGPIAAIAALTVSGLPPDKFLFLGYLPKKEGKCLKFLQNVKLSTQLIKTSIIIYESPYRLSKTLNSIKEVFGNVDIAICRELTKLYEEVRREKISEAIKHFSKVKPKGEFTIVF